MDIIKSDFDKNNYIFIKVIFNNFCLKIFNDTNKKLLWDKNLKIFCFDTVDKF